MDVHINPTLKVFDFVNICRVCLTEEDVILLEQEHLKTALRNILNIDVQQDEVELPKHICKPCVKKIEDILSFISLANACNAKLKEILSKNDNFCVFDDGEVSDNDSVKDEIRSENEIVHEIKVEGIKSDHDDETEWEEKPRRSRKKPSTCKKCNSKFNTAKELRKHQSQSAKCGSRKFSTKCEVCDENFQTVKKLREHQKENGNCKANIHKCTICNKIFDMKSRLKTHLRVHTDEQPYECKICGKGFKFAQNRRRHDNIVHKGIKPFKCDICGKDFSTSQSKKDHTNLHTGERPYCCSICSMSYANRNHYIWHKDKHKEGVLEEEIEDQKEKVVNEIKVECEICEKVFTSKPNLRKHLLYHGEKKHLCVTCGKSFFLKQQLDEHFRIHTGQKPHKCETCGKTFRLYNYYKAHVLTHTGEKPFKCDICHRCFNQKSHLKRHVDLHAGQKPFECGVCEKRFANKHNLGVHSRIHTGEAVHKCPTCNKGFYDTSNLKRHMKVHQE